MKKDFSVFAHSMRKKAKRKFKPKKSQRFVLISYEPRMMNDYAKTLTCTDFSHRSNIFSISHKKQWIAFLFSFSLLLFLRTFSH